ncbi:hypothetical protein, partial [Granulicatella adiacens]
KATDFDSVIRWFESSYPSPTGADSGAFFVARFFCTNLFFPTVKAQTFFQCPLLKPFGIYLFTQFVICAKGKSIESSN